MNLSLSKSVVSHNKAKVFAKCIAFSLAIAISAQITVPMYPVPVTLQTMVVVMIAMIAGPIVGVGAVVAYLLEGALGLPVFSNFTGGIVHLMGPTAGYLFGFILMAYFAGLCAEKGYCNSFVKAFLVSMIATALAVTSGVIMLSQFVGWDAVIAVGVAPFVLGSVLKSVFVASVIPRLK